MTSDSGIRSLQVAEHVWILSAPGERDLADVAALREEIDRVCAMGSTLVCDLSSTTFIDSSVIGVLVYAASRSDADARHRFTIVAPASSQVRRVLETVGMTEYTTIVEDIQQALATDM